MAQVLEALMGLAQRTGATRVRTGPKDAALRSARICYDHLAGERGGALLKAARQQGLIDGDQDLALTDKGRAFFAVSASIWRPWKRAAAPSAAPASTG